MMPFPLPLRMELMVDPKGMPLLTREGRQLYRLLSPFRFRDLQVPAGFITDLCSKPQIVLSLLGDNEQMPSVPHDYAYNTHCMSRAEADAMLYDACLLSGVPKWRAWAIYLGVRIGGASHWGPDKPVKVEEPHAEETAA